MTITELVQSILQASDIAGEDGRAFVLAVEALIEQSGLSANEIAAARCEAGARLRAQSSAAFDDRHVYAVTK